MNWNTRARVVDFVRFEDAVRMVSRDKDKIIPGTEVGADGQSDGLSPSVACSCRQGRNVVTGVLGE